MNSLDHVHAERPKVAPLLARAIMTGGTQKRCVTRYRWTAAMTESITVPLQLRRRDKGQAKDVEHGHDAEEHVGPLSALVLVRRDHRHRGDDVVRTTPLLAPVVPDEYSSAAVPRSLVGGRRYSVSCIPAMRSV
jgi:hypothetical protein